MTSDPDGQADLKRRMKMVALCQFAAAVCFFAVAARSDALSPWPLVLGAVSCAAGFLALVRVRGADRYPVVRPEVQWMVAGVVDLVAAATFFVAFGAGGSPWLAVVGGVLSVVGGACLVAARRAGSRGAAVAAARPSEPD